MSLRSLSRLRFKIWFPRFILIFFFILMCYKIVAKKKKIEKANVPPIKMTNVELDKITVCCGMTHASIYYNGLFHNRFLVPNTIMSAYFNDSFFKKFPRVIQNSVLLTKKLTDSLYLFPKNVVNILYSCKSKNKGFLHGSCTLHWFSENDNNQLLNLTCADLKDTCLSLKVPVIASNFPEKEFASYRTRLKFCQNYQNYEDYCSGIPMKPINFMFKPAFDTERNIDYQKNIDNIPIIVVASNRPHYLIKCIDVLLSTDGVRTENVIVHSDSNAQEVADVVKLFGLKYEYFKKLCFQSCEISQHYLHILKKTFNNNPQASEIIIIEEDLYVAPDIMVFFSSTVEYLRKNSFYYCISAWNDQSYKHSVGDPSLLYLTETMPGLGWVLKREIFLNDLLPIWPRDLVKTDWDVWMRTDSIRKGRECIIPDISRTFHFGTSGISMTRSLYKRHFESRFQAFFEYTPFDTTWLEDNTYDFMMNKLINESPQLNNIDVCGVGIHGYIAFLKGKTLYKIHNNVELANVTRTLCLNNNKIQVTSAWLQISSCWKLWTMDVRSMHNGVLRLWFDGIQYLVVMKHITTYDTSALNCMEFKVREKRV